MHIRQPNIKMLRHAFLNFFNRYTPIVSAQKIVQHFLGCLKSDRTAHQGRVSDNAIQRSLEFTDIRGDLMC